MPYAFPAWVPTPRNDLIGSARYADAGQPLTNGSREAAARIEFSLFRLLRRAKKGA